MYPTDAIIKVPDTWDAMAPTDIVKPVDLNPTSTEFRTVEANLMQTSAGSIQTILKVSSSLTVHLVTAVKYYALHCIHAYLFIV